MSLLLVFVLLQAENLQPIPYYDPAGRLPSTHEEYAAGRLDLPFQANVLSLTEATSPGTTGYDNLVLVFVNSGLRPAIETELGRYVADLASDGFSAKVLEVSGGWPVHLRQALQAHRDSGLVGAVMVGDLPVAWWEDGSHGEDYPLDLFFTDLDGVFADNDGDGKYDSHSGNRAPDIWLGRVYASRMTYDCEERLVRQFFDHNHAYRTGGLPVPRRGLVYNEVDWYPNDHGMSALYSDVTVYNDENTTTAHHYKQQLRLGFEFVHLIAHSSPWVHTFFLQGEVPGGGSVFNFEIPALAPNGAFYFLNACMCARYTEKDNLGNWYLFAQPWAQAVIASAQLMSGVNSLRTIYQALANDSCIGDAFKRWHVANYSMFRGTCLLGDPTVRITRTSTGFCPSRQVARSPREPGLDWTVYPVDTSNFVNGNPDIDFADGELRLVFDSGRKVRADTYWSWFQGSGFARPESIAWHEYYDLFPACATDASGRFWVVWQSFRDYGSGYDHFQLLSSYYYQGAWSSVRRVGPLDGYHDVQAALDAGTDDRVWCVFKSWRNGQADVWASYADAGADWAAPVRLTSDSLGQISPCVALDSADHPWAFWTSLTNGRWQVRGRYHNGSGWLPEVAIDTTGTNYCPRATGMADGKVWLVWHKWTGAQSDVYYAVWDGSAWSEPAPVTDDPADDVLPDVCTGPGGLAWACWQSNRTGHWDVYVSFYQDGWTTPQALTADTANDYDPVIAGAGNGVWIAWASDRRDYWNVYAAFADLTEVSERRPAGLAAVRISPSVTSGAPVRLVGLRPGARVELFDPSGRRVPGGLAAFADPLRLAPGTYFVRVSADGQTATHRVVVSR